MWFEPPPPAPPAIVRHLPAKSAKAPAKASARAPIAKPAAGKPAHPPIRPPTPRARPADAVLPDPGPQTPATEETHQRPSAAPGDAINHAVADRRRHNREVKVMKGWEFFAMLAPYLLALWLGYLVIRKGGSWVVAKASGLFTGAKAEIATVRSELDGFRAAVEPRLVAAEAAIGIAPKAPPAPPAPVTVSTPPAPPAAPAAPAA